MLSSVDVTSTYGHLSLSLSTIQKLMHVSVSHFVGVLLSLNKLNKLYLQLRLRTKRSCNHQHIVVGMSLRNSLGVSKL